MTNIPVFQSVQAWQDFRKNLIGSIGLVPTMGALHEGHASLLKQSINENDFTILTIFVNPTQFNDPKDLEKYPRTFEKDYKMATECGVHAIFCADAQEIYADHYRYRVTENNFSKMLCGASRLGHFDGVLSIVMKLFNIVRPEKAYFGEKDFQQLRLIEDMVQAFFMPIQIRRVKIVRESSGLAMSSRNMRLSPEGREKAALIYQTITQASTIIEAKNILTEAGFQIDYIEDREDRRFVAVFLEGIRLIDNVAL